QLINLLAVWGGGLLLVFRSGFPILFGVPVLFSFLFSYEYPVIARNYGLGIMGLFLYADVLTRQQRHRTAKTIAAQVLMCWSTVHFLAMALILFLFRAVHAIQKKDNGLVKWAKIELAFILPFSVSVLVLWPTGKGQFSSSLMDQFQAQNLRDSLSNSMLPFDLPGWWTFIIAIAGYLLLLAGTDRPLRAAGMFLAGASILEAIFCFKYYSGAPRHSGLLFVWLCSVLWINGIKFKSNRQITRADWRLLAAPLTAWLFFAWNFPVTWSVWRLEYEMNFSDAIEAAKFLNSTEIATREVICWPPRNCSAILAYMPVSTRFWSPFLNRKITFDHWDRESHEVHGQQGLEMSEVLQRTMPFFPNWGRKNGPVFVTMRKVKSPEMFGLRLIIPAPRTAWRILDESFWIYGPVGDEAPEGAETGLGN
ncbi:hypothetical protein EBZ80_07235, partial [bacterium]|nr:hypothetical protein [bacterium]